MRQKHCIVINVHQLQSTHQDKNLLYRIPLTQIYQTVP